MKGRGLQVLLICSLVLNVFVIGAIAGAALMWRRAEAERPVTTAPVLAGGRAGRLRQAAAALSPPYRRELRRMLAATLRELQPDLTNAREARAEAARLLEAPKLDEPAVQAALARARQADLAVRTRLETTFAKFAATLPPDERAALARALARPGGARRGR